MIGSKEIPISWAGIVPAEKRLLVTVGIEVLVPGDKVSTQNVSDSYQNGDLMGEELTESESDWTNTEKKTVYYIGIDALRCNA